MGFVVINAGGFIPRIAARFAARFEAILEFKIQYLKVSFPAHQKSSARGMRV